MNKFSEVVVDTYRRATLMNVNDATLGERYVAISSTLLIGLGAVELMLREYGFGSVIASIGMAGIAGANVHYSYEPYTQDGTYRDYSPEEGHSPYDSIPEEE